MELDELKEGWQKYNERINNQSNGFNRIIVRKKSWIVQNKIALNGIICIAAALLLFILLFRHISRIEIERNLAMIICCSIIGIYTFVKGIFTLLYFRAINKTDNEVHQFMLKNLNNQLFFVYEQMLWLWGLLPSILLLLPVIIVQFIPVQEGFYRVYFISIGIIYLTTVLVFSGILCKKRKKIISEIKEANQ